MAKKDFIFQGFTAKTHKEAIARIFDVPDLKRVIVSVAFVNKNGVDLLEAQLKKHGANAQAFIGIRNDITSTQGAKHLLSLGVSLFVVDTGSRSVIFHPKLYLARGAAEARLVIGSANLTISGLNNNIEAGFSIDFDLNIAEEEKIVDSIEREFDALVGKYPEHVFAIKKSSSLDELELHGRLIDEMTSPPPRTATTAAPPGGDTLKRIKLMVLPLRRTLAAAKKAVVKPKKPLGLIKKSGSAAASLPPPVVGVDYELVWESKALTRRDLNVPDGVTTNRTGSINLDKGLLAESIDHRHYFRDNVFSDVAWSATSSPKVEEGYAKFELVLKGISYGEFDLRIGHSTSITSKTYQQKNAMTRLSWGPMREYVARPDLIGRALALYRDRADAKRFILEID